MAINNPAGGVNSAGLLEQVLAEREQLASGRNPSAQPSALIRGLVQNPKLQSESPGSSRVVAAKPNLGIDASQAAVPPASLGPGGVAAQVPVPAGPGGIVGPNVGQEVPPPPGPAAPGGPEYVDPNAPRGGGGGAPVPAPQAAAPIGRPASPAPVRSFTAPTGSRLGNRLIVDISPRLQPRGTGLA